MKVLTNINIKMNNCFNCFLNFYKWNVSYIYPHCKLLFNLWSLLRNYNSLADFIGFLYNFVTTLRNLTITLQSLFLFVTPLVCNNINIFKVLWIQLYAGFSLCIFVATKGVKLLTITRDLRCNVARNTFV